MIKVRFENIAYHDNPEIDGHELSEEKLAEINDAAKKKGFFKGEINRVVEAHLAFDEGQDDTEIKTFVCVTLEVDYDTTDEGDEMEAPEDLLELAAEAIAEETGETLSCDDAWEVAESEEA